MDDLNRKGYGYFNRGYGRGLGRRLRLHRHQYLNGDTASRGAVDLNAENKELSKLKASIDESKCVGCLVCARVCSVNAISKVGSVAKIDESKCIGCGNCITVCPKGAITLKEINA